MTEAESLKEIDRLEAKWREEFYEFVVGLVEREGTTVEALTAMLGVLADEVASEIYASVSTREGRMECLEKTVLRITARLTSHYDDDLAGYELPPKRTH